MHNVLPWILLFWPYVLFPCGYLMIENQTVYLFAYIGLSLIVFFGNIIFALFAKDSDGGRRLARWNMILKLAHIPFYVILFFIAAMTIAAPVIALFAFVFDLMLFASTSVYGIKALVQAKTRSAVTTGFFIINIIAHTVYVLDVISSVALCRKLHKSTNIPNE